MYKAGFEGVKGQVSGETPPGGVVCRLCSWAGGEHEIEVHTGLTWIPRPALSIKHSVIFFSLPKNMTQGVKCLPSKHKDLGSILRAYIQSRYNMVVCTYNPSAGRSETGGFPRLFSQPIQPNQEALDQ